MKISITRVTISCIMPLDMLQSYKEVDMDNYTLMKLSERYDEDAIDIADFEREELLPEMNDAEKFKEKYKEFYTDIKLTIKEDW